MIANAILAHEFKILSIFSVIWSELANLVSVIHQNFEPITDKMTNDWKKVF